MKRITVLPIVLLAISAIIFESCKKYEDGPGLSFRSRKERIANTWRVSKYYEGNIDKTDDFNTGLPNYTVEFDKDGDMTVRATPLGILVEGHGTWDLIENDEFIRYDYELGNTTYSGDYKILRLKEKELWVFEEMDTSTDDDDREIHLVPVED